MADTTTSPIHAPATVTDEPGFVRAIGLFDGTMIVVGSMIGSGIFIVSADIARQTGSAGGLLLAWIITGLLTIAAALSYGELAALLSSRRRPIHLSSRGLFAALGIPLRLDAFPGHPDRHHRRRCRWFRALHGCACTFHLAIRVDHSANCVGLEVRD